MSVNHFMDDRILKVLSILQHSIRFAEIHPSIYVHWTSQCLCKPSAVKHEPPGSSMNFDDLSLRKIWTVCTSGAVISLPAINCILYCQKMRFCIDDRSRQNTSVVSSLLSSGDAHCQFFFLMLIRVINEIIKSVYPKESFLSHRPLLIFSPSTNKQSLVNVTTDRALHTFTFVRIEMHECTIIQHTPFFSLTLSCSNIVSFFHFVPKINISLCLCVSELNKNPVEGFSAGLIDDNDIYKWEVLIIGPPDTL